mgnify:CR=1 FL=1
MVLSIVSALAYGVACQNDPVTPRTSSPMPQATAPVAGSPSVVDGVSASPLAKEPEPTWTIPWLLADRIARAPGSTIIERKAALGRSFGALGAIAANAMRESSEDSRTPAQRRDEFAELVHKLQGR